MSNVLSLMSKESFEHKVIEAHEPPKVEPKKYIKNPKLKAAGVFLFSFICLIGLFLIIRGIFFVKSPIFDNSAIVDSVNEIIKNSPVDLNGFNIFNPGNTVSWGVNVKSPFTPDYSNGKRLIEATIDNLKYVAVLNQDTNYSIIYTLPKNAGLINLYEGDSITYVVNFSNGIQSKFYVNSPNNVPIQIHSLNGTEEYINTYYEPSEKLFYLNFVDEQGFLNIVTSNFDSKSIQIFKSDFLNDTTKILKTDNIKGRIYLSIRNPNLNCYYVNLKDKSLIQVACESIKMNDLDKLFSTNSNSLGSYTSNVKGEIYLNTSSDPNRRIILTGSNGEVFGSLSYHQNYLYFVSFTLEQSSSAKFTAKPKAIEKLNLSNFQRTVITTKMPVDKITKIIQNPKDLYVIVQVNSISSQLLVYNENPEPVSFPTSFPLQPEYWESVGEFDQVRLLEAQYVLD